MDNLSEYCTCCCTSVIVHIYNNSVTNLNDNDNDNDNILFDHNLQIEITIYNRLENQIIYKLVWRLLLRQNNLSLP